MHVSAQLPNTISAHLLQGPVYADSPHHFPFRPFASTDTTHFRSCRSWPVTNCTTHATAIRHRIYRGCHNSVTSICSLTTPRHPCDLQCRPSASCSEATLWVGSETPCCGYTGTSVVTVTALQWGYHSDADEDLSLWHVTSCRLVYNYLRFTDQKFWIFDQSTALFQQATDCTISLYKQQNAFLEVVWMTVDRKLNIVKCDHRKSGILLIFLQDITPHHLEVANITTWRHCEVVSGLIYLNMM